MRRTIQVVCATILALSLVACGGEGTQSVPAATADQRQVPANSLEALIQDVQADFDNTSQRLLEEQEKMFSEVGDTYESYTENMDLVQKWYDLAVSETEALGGRVRESGRAYYQAVVDSVDVTEDRNWDRATEDFYDAVYEDAFEDYYDAIYEDAYDEAYDAYYDGIVSDAYDVTPYNEWSDTSSATYDAWSDSHSDLYDVWSDARSDVYDDYSDVRSAFYSNDFDVEGLFAPVEVSDGASANEDATSEQDVSDATAEVDISGVSPEFKATMDEYEAFFNEYTEYLAAYNADPTSAELLAQYSDMMAQYAETMESMNSIDADDLSPADAAYYMEVTARITREMSSAL